MNTLSISWETFANQILTQDALTIVTAVVTVLAGLFSFLASAFSNRSSREFRRKIPPREDIREQSRIRDVRAILNRNQVVHFWSSAASVMFTFGQVVMGGLLASSFLQQTLSKDVVGVLGLLVVFSSLVIQTYRPGLHAFEAKTRMFKARKLIRQIEDAIFELEQGEPCAPTIVQIRRFASRGIANLEDIELTGDGIISDAVRHVRDQPDRIETSSEEIVPEVVAPETTQDSAEILDEGEKVAARV